MKRFIHLPYMGSENTWRCYDMYSHMILFGHVTDLDKSTLHQTCCQVYVGQKRVEKTGTAIFHVLTYMSMV